MYPEKQIFLDILIDAFENDTAKQTPIESREEIVTKEIIRELRESQNPYEVLMPIIVAAQFMRRGFGFKLSGFKGFHVSIKGLMLAHKRKNGIVMAIEGGYICLRKNTDYAEILPEYIPGASIEEKGTYTNKVWQEVAPILFSSSEKRLHLINPEEMSIVAPFDENDFRGDDKIVGLFGKPGLTFNLS